METEIETKYFIDRKYGRVFEGLRNSKKWIISEIRKNLQKKGLFIKIDEVLEGHIQKKHRPYIYFDLPEHQFYHGGVSFSFRYKGKKGFGLTVKLPIGKGTEERIEFDDTKTAKLLKKEEIKEEKALEAMLDFKSNDYSIFEHKNEKIIKKLVNHLRKEMKNKNSVIRQKLREKGLRISDEQLDSLERFEDDFIQRGIKKLIFNVYLETCSFFSNGKEMGYFTFDQVMDQNGNILFYEIEVEIKDKKGVGGEIYESFKELFDKELKGISKRGNDKSKYQRVVEMIHKW